MNFDTEQSRKFDGGKPRYDLIPAYPLDELAKVYSMGAAKYEDRGWEKGIKWSRIFAAIMRHLWAFWRGEDKDPESGLPHVIHAAWGCFALAEYKRTHPGFDDRPTEIERKYIDSAKASSYATPMPGFAPAEGIPGQVYLLPPERRWQPQAPSKHP